MTNQILNNGINLNELLEQIGQLIDKKFGHVQQPTDKNLSKLISRKEVAKLLGISLPTLHEWSKEGVLCSYKIGSKILYKLDEVENALQCVPTHKHKKGGLHV